jgi:DNA-binding LacI/PurR family transcriptional regulator
MKLDRNNPLPLYAQLLAILKEKCQAMEQGVQFPTERELVAEYEVNRLTARKAVDELVRDGSLSRMKGKGTFVTGKSDAEARTPNILLLLPSSLRELIAQRNYILAEFAQGVMDGVAGNANLVVTSVPPNANEADFCLDRINDPATDGVVLLQWHNLGDLIDAARAGRKPFALLGVRDREFAGMNDIHANDLEGARRATAHLIGLGHRRIMYLGKPIEKSASELDVTNRYLGYCQALGNAGIALDETLVLATHCATGISEEDRQEVGRVMADPDSRPSAIFAAGDRVALDLLESLGEIGVRVPEDVSIIGTEDVKEPTICSPKLSIMHKPRYETGLAAVAEVMTQLEEGFRIQKGRVFDLVFVDRGSCVKYEEKSKVLDGISVT